MDDFQKGTIEYFRNPLNRRKILRRAEKYISIFDIRLSLSERMQLRQETESAIRESLKVKEPKFYQSPDQFAAASFIFKNYQILTQEERAQ